MLVEHFHNCFGVACKPLPFIDNKEVNKLRVSLLKEEVGELESALKKRDPVAVLDALTDIQYVLDGAYLALGFHGMKDAATREVHRSNMSKLGADGKPIRREDGKILKGPNFTPPDLGKIIELYYNATATRY